MKPAHPVDPRDPRAPSQEVWDRLGPDERARVLAALPSEEKRASPEGDPHQLPMQSARGALRAFWDRTGRKAYVAADMNVYYPGEHRFAPDILVVLDVEVRERDHWVVSHEGKGLDFALEITVHGDRRKDAVRNVEWFARLGIPEYFHFDVPRRRLVGYRLADGGVYEPIVPQHGRFASLALGLDLSVEDRRVRFHHGTAPLLDPSELLVELEQTVDEAFGRAERASAQAEEEAARALAIARGRVTDLCDVLDISIDEARRAELAELDTDGAVALAAVIKRDRAWPSG